MKAKNKKHTATGNFHNVQMLRSIIKDEFNVKMVKWGGNWNGLNHENFTFYCSDSELEKIKKFSKEINVTIVD